MTYYDKWFEDGDSKMEPSGQITSKSSRSRRSTFTIRVPLAIAKLVDELVEGDDTLESGEI